jgi:moderate conductance mechanosensitive channel
MHAGMIVAELASACGAAPSFLCRLVYDNTGSDSAAAFADLLVRPLRVAVILLVAFAIHRLVVRAIDRVVDGIVVRQEAKRVQIVAGQVDAATADTEIDDAEAAADVSDDQPEARPRPRFLELGRSHTDTSAVQIERGKQRASTLGAVLRSGAGFVIYGTALVMALGEFDVNLGPLIASAGIAGIAIGFGAQKLVQDFLSGIFMVIEDQYGVGDIVDVGEASGVVEAVNLRTTRIRDLNGTLWHVPNGEIRRVGNKSQTWARAVIDVDVAYDTDLDAAAAVIKQVADGLWHEDIAHATVLEEPEVMGVEGFGPDAISFRLIMKVEPAEQFAVAREIRRRLKAAFDREGIEIPFPQRTVWVRRLDPPLDAPPAERDGGLE